MVVESLQDGNIADKPAFKVLQCSLKREKVNKENTIAKLYPIDSEIVLI